MVLATFALKSSEGTPADAGLDVLLPADEDLRRLGALVDSVMCATRDVGVGNLSRLTARPITRRSVTRRTKRFAACSLFGSCSRGAAPVHRGGVRRRAAADGRRDASRGRCDAAHT